jgi:uncharacterized protein
MEYWPADAIEGGRENWQPPLTTLNKEIDAVTGSLAAQIGHQHMMATFLETFVFLTLFLWRAGGLMLVGMALYKWGVLTAEKNNTFYWRGIFLSMIPGFALIGYGMYRNFQENWSYEYSMFLGSQFNYWGSVLVSFGYICKVMLFARFKNYQWIKKRLAAVGQMALTNYISQSFICMFIFFGIGFSLYGSVDRLTQIGVVLAIWLLQVAWSKPWMEKFRFGPLEWIWRSLTYGNPVPMKRSQPTS